MKHVIKSSFNTTKFVDNQEEYIKTAVGYIPKDWNLSRVGKACQIVNNLRKPISEEERRKIQGCYPYYGPTKVQDYINEYAFEGKYALIGEDGDHFLKYKDKSVTLLVEGKFNVNNHAHVLKGKKECLTEWFYHYYRHRSLYAYLTRQGAKRYKLTKEALMQLPIPLPSNSEQHKITEILFTWDKAIELKEKLIEQKREQKKGLMQKLLTGEERISGFMDEWKEVRLGDVLKERKETGCSGLELLAITSKNGVVRRTEINSKDNSSEDKSKYKRILPNDIGYNTMRMWQGVSGVSRYEGIVSPAYTVLKPTEKVDPTFVGYLFKLPHIVDLFKRYSQGLVNDTLNLKYTNLKVIKVTISQELEEQKAISKVLLTCDREIKLLEKDLQEIKQQKKGLMQLLLTGKIRVKV